jgi:hypothetical protein
MNERRRAYVAGNYVHLQGFRFIPLGMVCLFISAWNLSWFQWLPLTDDFAGILAVVLVIGAVIASYLIEGCVYETRFGSALPKHRLGTPGVLLAFVLCLAAGWLQRHFSITFSLPVLVVALCLACVGIRAGGLRNHYIALSAAWALFIMVPLAQSQTKAAAFYGLIGVTLVIGGIGDHRALTRVLRSMERSQL